jgi:ABC-type multidrug transport system fused ATPase/permease subunit
MAVGLSQGWQLALVLAATLPIVAGTSSWMAKSLADCSQAGEAAYIAADGVAEEAIAGIRTVVALCGERRERDRYSLHLRAALAAGIRKARTSGLGFGAVMGSFFAAYALALWCASHAYGPPLPLLPSLKLRDLTV